MPDEFNTDDMLDTYLYENRQLLENLQQIVLAQKDEKCFDQMSIHKIFRTMHTIKGSSGVMMFDNITLISHKLEDVFAVIRESQAENIPHIQLVEYVLAVADFISGELSKIESGKSADGNPDELVSSLDAFLELVKSKADGKVRESYITKAAPQQFYIAPATTEAGSIPSGKSDRFDIIIDLESSVEEIEARVERTQKQIMEEAKTKDLMPGDFVIQTKESGWLTRADKSRYIHVDIAKLDQLTELMEALTNSQTEVVNHPELRNLTLDDFHEAASYMQALSQEVTNLIVSIRRIPLTNLFQKMNRIVFDMSRKLGKDVELVMEGEDTELDKNITEQISDPLMHLIRNAVDHGIETPEQRILLGKKKRGQITLSARKDDENIWITVSDNGAGLDRECIFNKACEKGLVSKNIDEYTDREIYQLITIPGFSTSETVSEYSGRGVGMDVVMANLTSLGGNLEIESEKGEGSRMILQIPLR